MKGRRKTFKNKYRLHIAMGYQYTLINIVDYHTLARESCIKKHYTYIYDGLKVAVLSSALNIFVQLSPFVPFFFHFGSKKLCF